MKIKIGVIFGGQSVEHEISIISALQAINEIKKDKYEVIPLYIAKDQEWYTGNVLKDIENYQDLTNLKRYAQNVVLYKKGKRFVLQSKSFCKRIIAEIDLAFPIVHGANVEDGTLQGYLEMIGIPYVGSDLYGGVVGQDKVFMKQIFAASNLPITNYIWFFDTEYYTDKEQVLAKIKTLKYPLIVKPARLGSSIGITIVNKNSELETALLTSMRYNHKIVVEEVVTNLTEVNCSVLGNYDQQEVSALEEVSGSTKFLSYQDKYLSGSKGKMAKGMVATNRVIPARINKELSSKVKALGQEAFRVLNASGVVRIDFLIDAKSEQVYLNEINLIPGSLSFYLWEPVGKKYGELIEDLIQIALRTKKRKEKLITSFSTNILQKQTNFKNSKLK